MRRRLAFEAESHFVNLMTWMASAAALAFVPAQALAQPDRPAGPVAVEGDADQLQQLLLNLAMNALDVVPRRGSLEIELRLPQSGWVEVRVSDSGPGIAPALLTRVFEPFFSGKDSGLGLGLGLTVSRRIAEDHGGSLDAFNRPEGGACFVLRLPVSQG